MRPAENKSGGLQVVYNPGRSIQDYISDYFMETLWINQKIVVWMSLQFGEKFRHLSLGEPKNLPGLRNLKSRWSGIFKMLYILRKNISKWRCDF